MALRPGMELPIGGERWVPATSAGTQPYPEKSVIGCKIPQEMRAPFSCLFGGQPPEIARLGSQLVRNSSCVIR